jgi:hypothetical protein
MYGDQPFGLRDLKLTTIPAGSQVDLPAAQQLKVTPTFITGTLTGDDALKAHASFLRGAEWEMTAGGIALEAYAVLIGNTMTTSGSTPNAYKTLTARAGDPMPYFKIYGQALGVGTDDIHCKIFKAKVQSLEGELKEGEFFISKCSGIAIDDDTNGIWEWVQNETAATLPAT